MRDLLRYLSWCHRWLHQASFFLLLAATCAVFWAFRPSPSVPDRPAPRREAGEQVSLVVERQAHRLSLYCDDSLVAIHPCVVGGRGSQQTPSGSYQVVRVLRDEHYRPAFVLQPPTIAEARRWLQRGWIDKKAYQLLRRTRRKGAPTVEILGGGGQEGEWPAGYVVLEDGDLERLAPFMMPGTRVTIR